MRARITFKCSNPRCERHDQDVAFPNDKPLLSPEWCSTCGTRGGTLAITTGAQTFASVDAYTIAMLASADRRRLLERLVAAGAATDDDRAQLRACEAELADAVCPCCLQAFAPKQ